MKLTYDLFARLLQVKKTLHRLVWWYQRLEQMGYIIPLQII